MVYGLTNLAKMDDDSLDKMDPYQRGAQDISEYRPEVGERGMRRDRWSRRAAGRRFVRTRGARRVCVGMNPPPPLPPFSLPADGLSPSILTPAFVISSHCPPDFPNGRVTHPKLQQSTRARTLDK